MVEADKENQYLTPQAARNISREQKRKHVETLSDRKPSSSYVQDGERCIHRKLGALQDVKVLNTPNLERNADELSCRLGGNNVDFCVGTSHVAFQNGSSIARNSLKQENYRRRATVFHTPGRKPIHSQQKNGSI
jgi:hypothetical protein